MHELFSALVSRVQVVWLALALSPGSSGVVGHHRFAYALLLPPMRGRPGLVVHAGGGTNTINALGYLLGALVSAPMLLRHASAKPPAAGRSSALATVFMGLCGFFLDAPSLLLQRLLAGVASALIFIAAG